MDNSTLALYMHELQNHTKHVQAGFEILNRGLEAGAVGEVLYGGQMILLPASQISSLLWPTRARARKRGEDLRKVLKLNEKHPLNDRRLSEIWEHSDEKMEEFIKTTHAKRVVFDLVGDPFALAQEGEEPVEESNVYRAYDPARKIYFFRGVPYNVQGLGQALGDVGTRIMNVYFQLFPEAAKQEQEYQKQRAEAIQKSQAEQQAKLDADKAEAEEKAPSPAAKKAPAKTTAAAKKETTKKAAPKKAPAKKAAAKKEG